VGIGMGRLSERVVLLCEECGERIVLGDPDEVWLSIRTLFECECGHNVSLANRLEVTGRTGDTRDRNRVRPRRGMG
jgi:hypothetical protein